MKWWSGIITVVLGMGTIVGATAKCNNYLLFKLFKGMVKYIYG